MTQQWNDDQMQRLRWCFQPRQWFCEEGEPEPEGLTKEGCFMWVYRKFSEGTDQRGARYCVGYFFPDKTWFAESEWATAEEAAARVNFLNGGRGQ